MSSPQPDRLDDRTDAFRRKSTEEQRALIQKDKDALERETKLQETRELQND